MKKRKILYISMSIPYDNVPHAGGKTFNYYINGFANDIDNEVTMIAKVLPEEEHQIENINPNINTIIVRTPKNKVTKSFPATRARSACTTAARSPAVPAATSASSVCAAR